MNRQYRHCERRRAASPLLGKGGVDATSTKMLRSHLYWSGRGGSFNYRLIGGLNEPPRLRRAKEASRHLINGAATPPWLRRGMANSRGAEKAPARIRNAFRAG